MKSMVDACRKYGNNIYPIYLDVLRDFLEQRAQEIGYHVTHWQGYYTGDMKQMTHYYGRLEINR